MTLPKINRRAWIALDMQARRRKRLGRSTPVLRPVYPDKLAWSWSQANPYRWNIWVSADNGVTWMHPDDYWTTGDDHDFWPDGGSSLHVVVGVDAAGNEITPRSNAVRPEDALYPAPVLRAAYPDLLQWDWPYANPYKWNVWMSLDGGASWIFIEDYWAYGAARQFAPDGGSELYYIVGVDASGVEVTEHSNVICPDDAPAPFVGFPDNGVSTASYNMTGNALLLHFNGSLADTSGNGLDVTPYEGGTWDGVHYGVIDDIAYNPFFAPALGVQFNWAGGRSETYPNWSGAAGTTIIFWVKLSYSPTEAEDGFNFPFMCFCPSSSPAGLMIQGGIPFDAESAPPRYATTAQLNLSHGTYYGICAFTLQKYIWQQVAIVSNADYHQVYVNGYLADENFTETITADTGLRFGGWYDDAQMSVSPAVELAEFAVFNRAMTAGEIENIYQLQHH